MADVIPLRGGGSTTDRRLDRVKQFDPKSRLFKAAEVLPVHRDAKTQMWVCGAVLDQGEEGACVGFSWTHELIADPFPTEGCSDSNAREIYILAKQLDDFEGEDYEGTSVLAGAKALQQLGYLTEYRWAFTVENILLSLSYRGPVVLGVNWYQSMYEPSGDTVTIAGDVAGGHAIMARGVDIERQAIVLHNSWGSSWGGGANLDPGDAWLSFDDLRRLMDEDGECCVPLLRE